MYISTELWRDLTDGHLYRQGDPFPFDGREVDAERLAQLETGRNRAGLRLIQAMDTPDEETEAPEQEAPEGATEAQETDGAPQGEKPRRNRTRK